MAAELFGGIGVLFGFLTPLAALGIVATMSVALAKEATTPGALKALMESGEIAAASVVFYPFALAMCALALVVMGGGKYSIDAKLFKPRRKSA